MAFSQLDWTNRVLDAVNLTRDVNKHGVNYTEAAKMLGVHRETVKRSLERIERTGLATESGKHAAQNLRKEAPSSTIDKVYKDVIQSRLKEAHQNTGMAAARLGVSEKTLIKQIKKMERGEPIYTRKQDIKRAVEKAGKAPGYFEGGRTATEIKKIDGKNWKMQDYIVRPGETLPSPKEGEKGPSQYQIIIKGKDKHGNERTFTTSLAGTPKSALRMAEKMMKKYKGAKGGTMIIRTFSR